MCNTNNNTCCHEEDFLCYTPIIHCCGGYSEHNNCCPHNECHNYDCDSCCDSCDKPMCCCCYKLKKSFDEFKDETKGLVTSLTGRLERLEIKEGDDYTYLLGQIRNLAQKELSDVDRLDDKIDAETRRATEKEDQLAADGFADVDYIYRNDKPWLVFKNKDGEELKSIDASPFIKDGMIDTVSLIDYERDKALKIIFNTDAGKEPIIINIGDLFEVDDYYTKSYIDNNYYTKGSIDGTVSNLNGSIQGVQNNLNNHAGNTDIHITAAERKKWNDTTDDLSNHVGNNVIHITAAERSKWNTKPDWTASESSDAGILNKPTRLSQFTNDIGTASTKDVPTSGNASASLVVMGNDSRLSDARTPVAHTHTTSDITNFPTNVSTFNNDAGYLTQHQSLSNYPTKSLAIGNVSISGNVLTFKGVDGTTTIATIPLPTYPCLWTDNGTTLTPATSGRTVTAAAFYDSSVS